MCDHAWAWLADEIRGRLRAVAADFGESERVIRDVRVDLAAPLSTDDRPPELRAVMDLMRI